MRYNTKKLLLAGSELTSRHICVLLTVLFQVPTFGVDFTTHLCATHCTIPYVVFKCIKHTETYGIHIKVIHFKPHEIDTYIIL